MSDIFNRNRFEAELLSQATPTFRYPQDSATIRELKNAFAFAGMKSTDFEIDPFEFHHIQDWYVAIQLERQLSYETSKFFGTPPTPKYAESTDTEDDLDSVRTPLLNTPSPAPTERSGAGSMRSQVDFNYQEPAFEHATDPQVPLAGPAQIPIVPPHTPIRERRMAKHEQAQLVAMRSIDSLSVNIFSPNLDLSRTSANKKRAASYSPDFLSPSLAALNAPKRTRLNSSAWVIANIDHMLGDIPTPSEADYQYELPPTPSPELQPRKITEVTSPIPAYTHNDLTSTGRPACSPNFKAYPGQHHTLTKDSLLGHPRPVAATNITWSQPRNANGRITHPALPPCSRASTVDLAGLVRQPHHATTAGLVARLDRFEDAAATNRVSCLRSASQRRTRALLHTEAAEARLRGQAVGRYRYEEGGMTVEEYLEAGACVCWEECACAVWCGRWPDVVCPCNGQVRWEE